MSNQQIEIRDFVADEYPAVANIRNTINPHWGDTPKAGLARLPGGSLRSSRIINTHTILRTCRVPQVFRPGV